MMKIDKSEIPQDYPMLCCFCDTKLLSRKDCHNAQPAMNSWCCGDCNTKIVIPYRLRVLTLSHIKS